MVKMERCGTKGRSWLVTLVVRPQLRGRRRLSHRSGQTPSCLCASTGSAGAGIKPRDEQTYGGFRMADLMIRGSSPAYVRRVTERFTTGKMVRP